MGHISPTSCTGLGGGLYSGCDRRWRLIRAWRPEARDELLDFWCNFGIMNEQKRAIIEAQIAAEPIPASTKLEPVSADPFRIER
jgi:hypothetical protein